MKKVFFFICILCLFNCSEEEIGPSFINMKLDLSSVSDYDDAYSFTDFRFNVYPTKADYFNDINVIYSGSFTDDGTVSIPDLEPDTSYFVDIYTEDFILSNWQVSDLDVDSSNTIVWFAGIGNDQNFYPNVSIHDYRKYVGDWAFVNYESANNSNLTEDERTDKGILSINKDFTVQSNETKGDKVYTVNYLIKGNASMDFVSVAPDDGDYPIKVGNTDGIFFTINDLGLLFFQNYSAEFVMYAKQ